MAKKQFKAESKRLLDMMIHSIYTHKEIFLRELISNASDAIDKRYYQSLTDESVGLKREEFRIRITSDEEKRLLTVSDNGVGMSEATKQRIFEQFFRGDTSRRSEGNGLGLPLAKRVVEIHGGSIQVESRSGKGSVFTVKLPCSSEKEQNKHGDFSHWTRV